MENFFRNLLLSGIACSIMGSCASHNKTSDISMSLDGAQNDEQKFATDNEFLIMSDEQIATIGKGNEFALNLFRALAGKESKVISPVSVSYLMGMLANGADGKAQDEILETMLSGDGKGQLTAINNAYRGLINYARKTDKQVCMDIANYIAVSQQVEVKKEYARSMPAIFDAKIEKLNFASKTAVEKINNWCAKKTEGMIPKIIDQLSPNDMAVLMNAVFFKATWKEKFDKQNTKVENFRGYTRDIKRVPMMRQTGKFMYTDESHEYSAIELPYGNGNYSMIVFLPKDGYSINEMMQKFDSKKLAGIRNGMSNCIVDLKLPRFTTTTDISLNEPISKLGASSIFDPREANFGNISNNNFHVSSMLQKAKIEVSEEGTKAAAVTAAIMALSALNHDEPRHVQFYADKPFVYVITENTTGAIFFIGQYTGSEL